VLGSDLGELMAERRVREQQCDSKTLPSQPRRSTRILFCVSVPVLSEQMTVAEPMVSHATSWRTSELARVIFCMARASDTVTLMGRPSGTATTMMITMLTT
jgi:hypothetical protein